MTNNDHARQFRLHFEGPVTQGEALSPNILEHVQVYGKIVFGDDRMSPPVYTGPTSAGFQSNPLFNMLL